MIALSIILLPEDLLLVGGVLAALSRAHAVTGGAKLTTDHIREETLVPWGRVLVVYDVPVQRDGKALPALAQVPPPVEERPRPRVTPLVLARMPRRN